MKIYQESIKSQPKPGAADPPVVKKAPGRMRRVSVALGIASDVEDRSRSLLSERFDICILLGDLNYRLEMEVPEIKQLLAMAEKMDSNFGQHVQSDIISPSPSPSLRRQSQLDAEASLDVTDQQRDIDVRSMRLEINQLKKIDKTQSDKAEDGDGDGDIEEDDGDEDKDEDGVPEFHQTEYRLVILNIIHT